MCMDMHHVHTFYSPAETHFCFTSTHTHRNPTQAFPHIRKAALRKSGMIVYMTEVRVIFDIFWQSKDLKTILCLGAPIVKNINNAIDSLTSRKIV